MCSPVEKRMWITIWSLDFLFELSRFDCTFRSRIDMRHNPVGRLRTPPPPPTSPTQLQGGIRRIWDQKIKNSPLQPPQPSRNERCALCFRYVYETELIGGRARKPTAKARKAKERTKTQRAVRPLGGAVKDVVQAGYGEEPRAGDQ